MTNTIFKDVEQEEYVKETEEITEKKEPVASLIYTINIKNIPLLKKIDLLKSLTRQIYLGATAPGILSKYYDSNVFEESPIFKPKNCGKEYLQEYFLQLLIVVGFDSDNEFKYWLSFIEDDDTGLTLDSHTEATEPSSFANALQYLKAVADLFTEIMSEEVDISTSQDPILKMYAEKELTLDNYLYLSHCRNKGNVLKRGE